MGFWSVSSDSHIVEPPDLYTSRFPERLRSRAPRVVNVDGVDHWLFDQSIPIAVYISDRAGDRWLPLDERPERRSYDDVGPRAWEPAEFLKQQEADGVWASVLFPSTTLLLYALMDSEALSACCRAYTDWAVEFAAADPARIRPIGMLNVDDPYEAVTEMERQRSVGIVGTTIPSQVPENQRYDHPRYERLWAAAEDLGMVLHMHTATFRKPCWVNFLHTSDLVNGGDATIRESIGDIIFGGVLNRHPGLRFVSVENEGSWAFPFMARMDWHFANNVRLNTYIRELGFTESPTELFKRHFYISYTEDAFLVRNRHDFAVDRIMWSNDFPHHESSFPMSATLQDAAFAGVPDDERLTIQQTTAAALYGFDVPARPEGEG